MSRTKLILMTAVSLSAAVPARAQVLYTVTDLGTLGGETSRAHGLNDRGQVVGEAGTQPHDEEHAFLWEHGVIIDLGTLPSDDRSTARAINDDGVIVGDSYYVDWYTGARPRKAVVWRVEDVRVIGRLNGTLRTATDLNADGHAVGVELVSYLERYAITSGAPEYNGVWRYPTLGGDKSEANAINDLNHVVGWSLTDTGAQHAFVSRDQELIDLGTLGGEWSIAHDISNRGEIVGSSENAHGETRAFLHRNGEMIEIGALPDATSMTALALNERSQIVGTAEIPAGGGSRAFLWTEVPIDLNDLIPPGSGWVLERAEDINEVGQIVGTGTHHGVQRAFLLTPLRNATILRHGPARP